MTISNLIKNGRKLSIWVENTVGKGEICLLRTISPFPTVFSKDFYYRHVKTRACLGKGYNNPTWKHFENIVEKEHFVIFH